MIWTRRWRWTDIRLAALEIAVLACLLSLVGCRGESSKVAGNGPKALVGKKVLYVDSYDTGYEVTTAVRQAFEKGVSGRGLDVTFAYLDEKRDPDSGRIATRAGKIAALCAKLNPDVVVAGQDPAMTYFVKPHLAQSAVPVVFFGVNWEAPERREQTTGQVEVELVERLVADLVARAKGTRVGILTASTETDRKSLDAYRKHLGIRFAKERVVGTFAEWKTAFASLQDSVDVLLVRQNAGIAGWDSAEAVRWTRERTRIPTGSVHLHMAPYVLLTYPKIVEEFGDYAAETVLKILGGTRPEEIPISRNSRMGIVVNVVLMRKLRIVFPSEFMENARCVPVAKGRVAFVNSYHKGYDWSDGVERGFLNALGISDSTGDDSYSKGGLELRFFRMDAKQHPDASFQTAKAAEIHDQLLDWKPDVIVASDDDASKWLIAPYYKGRGVPVVFCGLNWDASVYGFPARNVTGMVEVAPVRQLIDWLSAHAKGKRLGYLGADVLSETKELGYYREVLGIRFADGSMVKTFAEWKDAYRRLQKSSDMLILLSMVGVRDWSDSGARAFIEAESRIPTGTTTRGVHRFAMISFSRVPEEQGLWSGDQVRQILAGVPVADIPMTTNVRSTIFANPKLLDRIGIRLPASFLDTVFLIEEMGVR